MVGEGGLGIVETVDGKFGNYPRGLSETARLQLLLDLTKRITSNLELREVLPAVAANIREVIQCDAVVISLPDMESGTVRVHALDFPNSKGLIAEEQIIGNVRRSQASS